MKFVSSAIVVSVLTAAAQGQILNGNFESGFVPSSGHGEVPAPWSSSAPGNTFVSCDTWDSSGANGLPPSFNNVFTGVVAAEGNRWAGGWNFEDMHQLMGFALTPNQQYTISALVHVGNAAIPFGPAGWEFGLGATSSSTPLIVAQFAPTVTWSQGWVLQSATFTAPSNAGSLQYFFPRVYPVGGANSYMGIDDIQIHAVPTPGSLALLGVGGLLLRRTRR